MAKKRWHPREEENELVFSVCSRFIAKMQELNAATSPQKGVKIGGKKKIGAAAAVAAWLAAERNRGDITREKIYPLLAEGVRRDFLRLFSPRDANLAKLLAFKHHVTRYFHDERCIHVVDVNKHDAHAHVATSGADLVLELIKELGKKKDRVHIGLGPGNSARIVAKRLGQLLSRDPEVPDLTVHALSSAGLSLENPDTAPVTFFHFFDEALVDVKFVGLFTEAVVRCEDYQVVVDGPSVKASFDQKHEIDIVISAFNAAYCDGADGPTDHHCGIQGSYLDEWDKAGETRKELKNAGWVGHVQFLPYSATAPIQQSAGIRAVVLFELDELVQMAQQKDKYVVLLAGPCRDCGMIRSDALMPLLTAPALQVWTHLVLDSETAKHLVQPGP